MRLLTAGPKVEVNPRQVHATDILDKSRPGEHFWTAVAMWHVADPAADTLQLDTENLITVEGPGCFVCGISYKSPLAMAPCPGEEPEIHGL